MAVQDSGLLHRTWDVADVFAYYVSLFYFFYDIFSRLLHSFMNEAQRDITEPELYT